MLKILAISASLSGTKSRIVLDTLKTLFSEEVSFEIFDLKEHEIQFADGRDYRDYSGSTQSLIEKIIEADALVISSPIFQASIPGSLKNVFDLLPIDSLRDKQVAVLTTAGSDKHFLVAQYQLKPILQYMKAEPFEPTVFMTGEDFMGSEVISDDINLRLELLAKTFEVKVNQAIEEKLAAEAGYDF